MPPLKQLDDYDTCLYHNPYGNGIYCVSFVEVVPNTTSETWRIIEKYSAPPIHRFRHDILSIGTCLKRCKDLVDNLDAQEFNQYYVGPAQFREIVDYHAQVHDNVEYRKAYDELINKCLNYEYQQKYELKLRSNIEYCTDSSKEQLWDRYNVIFIIILSSIAFVCTFSTGYDYYLKMSTKQGNKQDFFVTKLTSKKNRFLTAFSLKRNYLKVHRNVGGTDDDLNFINGIRVVCNTMVIHSHVLLALMSNASTNAVFLEEYQLNQYTVFAANCSRIVNLTFFVMSAFLLKVNFAKKSPITPKSSWKSCVSVFWKFLIYRYLRLIPGLALVILYNATFYGNQIDSPTWKHATGGDHKFARINWWKNVIFINNWTVNDATLPTTWYLAADFQLFVIFLIILIVVAKKPDLKKLIYSIVFIYSILLPIFILIKYKSEYFAGLYMIYYQVGFVVNAIKMLTTSFTAITKIDTCLFSIITAEIYLKLKANSKSRSFKGVLKYELGCWICFMIFYALLYVDYNSDNITIALLKSVFLKNIAFFFWSLVMLAFTMQLGGFIRNILSSNYMQKKARLTYQAYLWHVAVLRIVMNYHRQPVYMSTLTILLNSFLVNSLTNIVAGIITVVFEYPVNEILNCFIEAPPKTTENFKSK